MAVGRQCAKCHPPLPPVRILDPENWKEEWHATRNADRLLEEDIVAFGCVLEVPSPQGEALFEDAEHRGLEVEGAPEDPQEG